MGSQKNRTPSWKKDLDLLTSRQLNKYEDSLEVLRLMRKGETLSDLLEEIGITAPTVKKYVGSALRIKNNRIVPSKTDQLLRKMRIYEDGQETWIQVKGIKKASLIGKYHSATGQLLDKNDRKALRSFRNKKIKDIDGIEHKLETRSQKIFEIVERREEPEFFTIYSESN